MVMEEGEGEQPVRYLSSVNYTNTANSNGTQPGTNASLKGASVSVKIWLIDHELICRPEEGDAT